MPEPMTFNPRSVELPGALLPLAQRWLAMLRNRGYAGNTIQAYQRDLERFAGYMISRDLRYAQLITSLHVEQFIDALLEGEQLAPRSAARVLASVRSFYAWLEIQGLVTQANNPLSAQFNLRWSRQNTIAPEIGEILKVVDGIPDDGSRSRRNIMNVRDRAMFRLMVDGALRISAVADLDIYDPCNPSDYCVHPNGVVFYKKKGGAIGETVVDDTTLAAINRWMTLREYMVRPKSPAALFLSSQGWRPTRATIHERIKHHAAKGGMGHLHSHLMRHARISHALEHGNLHLAHYLSGHSSKSTTADIYGDQPKARLRQQVRALCSLDEVAA